GPSPFIDYQTRLTILPDRRPEGVGLGLVGKTSRLKPGELAAFDQIGLTRGEGGICLFKARPEFAGIALDAESAELRAPQAGCRRARRGRGSSARFRRGRRGNVCHGGT